VKRGRAARLPSTTLALAIAWASVGGAGCGSARRVAPPERPIAVRDELPRATGLAHPTAVAPGDITIAVAGLDAARGLLFELLDAIRVEDDAAIRRLLAEETVAVHAYRQQQQSGAAVPRLLGTFRREVVVQRLLAARRVSRLAPETPLDALVEPARVEVVPASVFFRAGIPVGFLPGDLVLRFPVSEAGERALLAIALHGRGLVVVRVDPAGAFVVGL
jgi:hypothetical protein